ncbi:MAG: hypothetical protein C4526_07995 [Nitrospiraceae bacterium]|nr:MAG: hypothetical protein C4526_07995 [Nitrospiraceae bacterium]
MPIIIIKEEETMFEEHAKCNICKKEYTSTHVEVSPGTIVYVCQSCLDMAKTNFIWLCMGCGKAYIRPKQLVINRLKDPELKKAYMLCEDMVIVQGIDVCIECDPETISAYMGSLHTAVEC